MRSTVVQQIALVVVSAVSDGEDRCDEKPDVAWQPGSRGVCRRVRHSLAASCELLAE